MVLWLAASVGSNGLVAASVGSNGLAAASVGSNGLAAARLGIMVFQLPVWEVMFLGLSWGCQCGK